MAGLEVCRMDATAYVCVGGGEEPDAGAIAIAVCPFLTVIKLCDTCIVNK